MPLDPQKETPACFALCPLAPTFVCWPPTMRRPFLRIVLRTSDFGRALRRPPKSPVGDFGRDFGRRFESRLDRAFGGRGGRRSPLVFSIRRRVLALLLAPVGAGQQRAAIAGWAHGRRRASRGEGAGGSCVDCGRESAAGLAALSSMDLGGSRHGRWPTRMARAATSLVGCMWRAGRALRRGWSSAYRRRKTGARRSAAH